MHTFGFYSMWEIMVYQYFNSFDPTKSQANFLFAHKNYSTLKKLFHSNDFYIYTLQEKL